MKMLLLITFTGLAIGFVQPALAQEQNTVDAEVRQQIEAALRKHEEAYNEYDAAAFAAGFPQYAVGFSPGGMARGGGKKGERDGGGPRPHPTQKSIKPSPGCAGGG